MEFEKREKEAPMGFNRIIHFIVIVLFSLTAAYGISAYFNCLINSSFLFLPLVFVYLYAYDYMRKVFVKENRGLCVACVFFCILFSISTTLGKCWDSYDKLGLAYFLMCIGLFFSVLPLFAALYYKLDECKVHGDKRGDKKILWLGFLFVVLCWLLGYLAMFPGVYCTDGHGWYLSFSNPDVPITNHWSPVYAGVFYFFVHAGKIFFGNYMYGQAIFSAIQMIFLLSVIFKILEFVLERFGNIACVLCVLFFVVLPTHVIMALSSAQDSTFMGCFAMTMIEICRMNENPKMYWSNWKNWVSFIGWGGADVIFRNNAFHMFLLFILFIPLYIKGYRKDLFKVTCIIMLFALLYKGPVLSVFGVEKVNSLSLSLNLPVMQMACVYVEDSESLTPELKAELEEYIKVDALLWYKVHPSISDDVMRGLDAELVQKDLFRFLKLYFSVGLRAPLYYLKAFYIQNMGMLYIDKSYPDIRIWHPYLHYASYKFEDNSQFISIERRSLFPQYDNLLRLLFGYTVSGYGGETEMLFSKVPILNVLCRTSTYFWVICYLTCYSIFSKRKSWLFVLGLSLCYSLTISLAMLIMYRYYAPIIFAFPIILSGVLKGMNNIELENVNGTNKYI